MSTTSPGWTHCLDALRHAPDDSFEHRFGDQLATADDETALSVLIEIVTEDPCGTNEYRIAGHMLGHLLEREAAL